MKRIILSCIAFVASFAAMQAQQVPVYLDGSKSLEQRVEDALSRMTLQEKSA